MKAYTIEQGDRKILCFHCPACGHEHSYRIAGSDGPLWKWNGSLEKPTLTPSLLYKTHDGSAVRCHLFVTDGKIIYCDDCPHIMKGRTVDMEDINARS